MSLIIQLNNKPFACKKSFIRNNPCMNEFLLNGSYIINLEDIDIVGIIYEICSAMMYIHKMKIIHRDLKTTNILLDFNKHVKICDFGISKVMNLTTETSLTHEIGTLLYMAPELFQPDSQYNEKIDVYAFGVVLYFVLTNGKYPKYCGPGNLEKAKIPKSINKISMSLIKNCCIHHQKKDQAFILY